MVSWAVVSADGAADGAAVVAAGLVGGALVGGGGDALVVGGGGGAVPPGGGTGAGEVPGAPGTPVPDTPAVPDGPVLGPVLGPDEPSSPPVVEPVSSTVDVGVDPRTPGGSGSFAIGGRGAPNTDSSSSARYPTASTPTVASAAISTLRRRPEGSTKTDDVDSWSVTQFAYPWVSRGKLRAVTPWARGPFG